MPPHRRRRLVMIGTLLAGTALAVSLALMALNENINFFYPPAAIAHGEAPIGVRIYAGGMVKEGSVVHDTESLRVTFVISDLAGAEVTVRYEGLLPDLFREGQGVVARGRLSGGGVLVASEVLAKHDENYMPPELADLRVQAAGTRAYEKAGE